MDYVNITKTDARTNVNYCVCFASAQEFILIINSSSDNGLI